jgi:hypothetical protein
LWLQFKSQDSHPVPPIFPLKDREAVRPQRLLGRDAPKSKNNPAAITLRCDEMMVVVVMMAVMLTTGHGRRKGNEGKEGYTPEKSEYVHRGKDVQANDLVTTFNTLAYLGKFERRNNN